MVTRKVKIISAVSVISAVAIAVLVIGLVFGLRHKNNKNNDTRFENITGNNRCDTLEPSDLTGNGKSCSCGKDSNSDHKLQGGNCLKQAEWCFVQICSQDECDGICKAIINFDKSFYKSL